MHFLGTIKTSHHLTEECILAPFRNQTCICKSSQLLDRAMKPSGQLLIRRQRSFSLILLLCLCTSVRAASSSWDPSTYPNPQVDPARCGRSRVAKSWACDPDKILTKKSADVIEGILKDIADANDPYVPAKNCGGGQRLNEGYQASILDSSTTLT